MNRKSILIWQSFFLQSNKKNVWNSFVLSMFWVLLLALQTNLYHISLINIFWTEIKTTIHFIIFFDEQYSYCTRFSWFFFIRSDYEHKWIIMSVFCVWHRQRKRFWPRIETPNASMSEFPHIPCQFESMSGLFTDFWCKAWTKF